MVTAISGNLAAAGAVPVIIASILGQFQTPINQQVGIYLVDLTAVLGVATAPLLTGYFKIGIKSIFVFGWSLMSICLLMIVIFQLVD